MELARSEPMRKMTAGAAGIRIVEPITDAEARARIAQILKDERINTLLQPIVQMRGRKVVGVEALSRFPQLPVRPPNEWFAEALDVGLGEELELLAINSALRLLDSLPGNVYLSVNVSPTTVMNASLAAIFWGTNWSRVVLEITEYTSVEDYDMLNAALAPLKERGARIAVDDVGSGFAQLRQILNVEPEIIKCDIELSRGVIEDRRCRAMLAALVSFARESGSVVVAEGIETYEQMDALRDLGVDYGQGYLLGRPTAPANAPMK